MITNHTLDLIARQVPGPVLNRSHLNVHVDLLGLSDTVASLVWKQPSGLTVISANAAD